MLMFVPISWYFISIQYLQRSQHNSVLCGYFPKFLTKAMMLDQAESLISIMFLVKFGSLMNLRILDHQKSPLLVTQGSIQEKIYISIGSSLHFCLKP